VAATCSGVGSKVPRVVGGAAKGATTGIKPVHEHSREPEVASDDPTVGWMGDNAVGVRALLPVVKSWIDQVTSLVVLGIGGWT